MITSLCHLTKLSLVAEKGDDTRELESLMIGEWVSDSHRIRHCVQKRNAGTDAAVRGMHSHIPAREIDSAPAAPGHMSR